MIALKSSMILILTGTLGFLIVSFLTIEPLFSLVAIIGFCVLTVLVIMQPPLTKLYLSLLGLTLFGYASLGRGFAYLGKPPVYVGEVVLAIGCIVFTLKPNPHIFRSRITWFLFLLMFIGAIGTISNIGTYGIDAMRDGVLWGYGLFALLTGSLLLQQKGILNVVYAYQRWIPYLIFWIPVGMALYYLANDIIPRWPASDIPVLNPKGGDFAVHLAGAISFFTLGLYRLGRKETKSMVAMKEWVLWSVMLVGCVTIFTGRSAILTVLSTSLLIFVFRPSMRWAKPAALGLMLVIAFFAFDLKISFRDERPISTKTIIETVQSIFNFTGVKHYDGPRQWRLDWWGKILDYTVFGEFFWTGKGYGINLANDDGFQVFGSFHEQPLRSPHNSHLTFLARSGVPGFLAWLTLQGLFCIGLFQAYRKAVRSGRRDWANVNLWVLAYWFAFMVNASFDVFLEGPQGGIWFWCVFGFGIALMEIQRWDYPLPSLNRNPSKGATY